LRGYVAIVVTADRIDRARFGVSLGLAAVANRAYSVALVVYVFNATHSSGWVAAAAVARYLPGLATSALAPRLLVRYPPRRVLVVANACCAVALAAMAASVSAGASPAVAIALAAVVRAAASGQPVAAAWLLPVVAGGRDLSVVAARQATTDKLMLLAGPAIGGIALLVISPATELFALAVVVGVAALVSLRLPAPLPTRGPAAPTPRSSVAPTRAVPIPGISGVGTFIAFAAIAGFVYGTDTVLLAVLSSGLHLSDAGYGELFAGLGAGGILAAPVVNTLVRRRQLAGWIVIAASVYCVPSVLVVHTHSAVAVILLEALRGAGALTLDVVALTELQRIVLPRGLPVLTARLTTTSFAAVAAGALATPLMLHGLGQVGTFTAVGLVPPALVVCSYPVLRRSDRQMSDRLDELGPRIAVLESLGLLHASSRPVLERLAADITEVQVPAGTTVITEGGTSDAFYIVRSGELDVTLEGRRINQLHGGDWFGEIGLLEGLRRTATVSATSDCTLYRIGGQAFLEAFAQLPPSPTLLDSVSARLATNQMGGAVIADQPAPASEGYS
jgi:CRP-like cAMP-binding protein